MSEPKARSRTPFWPRALAPSADVDQLGLLLDERGEAAGLEAGPVVRDHSDRPDLAGRGIGDELERASGRAAARSRRARCSTVSIASRWFWVVETCQPSSTSTSSRRCRRSARCRPSGSRTRCRVGPERGAGLSAGPFPRPALRTGRAPSQRIRLSTCHAAGVGGGARPWCRDACAPVAVAGDRDRCRVVQRRSRRRGSPSREGSAV